MISAAGRPYATHALRLLPGEDVRAELERWAREQGIEAAAVTSAVGSLSVAVLRYGGQSAGTRTEGDLEVCALSGTLSRHGLHLHLAYANEVGEMRGGHLLNGCLVRTTLELVIQEIGGVRFMRRKDERTGYDELFPEVIRP
ncbi:MAG: DNA-binding protein [Flavobacteriales bacterium]|nr:DNA-binding protein [Flavobacteriales bacterium]